MNEIMVLLRELDNGKVESAAWEGHHNGVESDNDINNFLSIGKKSSIHMLHAHTEIKPGSNTDFSALLKSEKVGSVGYILPDGTKQRIAIDEGARPKIAEFLSFSKKFLDFLLDIE